MVPVYNESDIIGRVVGHLVSQGIELVIVDNGSTDGTYEICQERLGRGVLHIERLVSARFEFDLIVQKLYDIALKYIPDWTLLNAADEFLESPYIGLTLKEAIELDDQKGCNLIQFNNFEFWTTEQDDGSSETDIRRRLRYYTWNDDLQFRCWKVYPGIRVVGTAGHYPIFQDVNVRIPRTKYVLRHYRIRSYQHGLKKVFSERLPRYLPQEREQGMHIHYDNFRPDKKFFVIHSGNLTRYNDDGKWATKKTFDWTWGVKTKNWARPPIRTLRDLVATRFPFAVRIWKALFFRRRQLPTEPENA
jgi:glycosyltransferase involved in cell wall biosynthesis